MKMHPTAGRVTETDPCAVAQSHPAPALAVTVEIGADDIEQGHMAKCRSCPTALAANRATGRFCDAGGFHLIAYDNAQYMENENLLVGLLPEAAKLWIARFDAQRDALVADPPGPMRFPLELYRIVDFARLDLPDDVRALLTEAAQACLAIAFVREVYPNPATVEFAGRNRHFAWTLGSRHGASPFIDEVYRQAARAGADYVSHRPGDLKRLPAKYRTG